MADDWRQIPGNEHAFERLRDALASGEAIAFVGAGASAGLYPLWTGLIRRLADEAVKQGMAVEADRDFWLAPATKPQQAVRGIKQALGQGAYGEALRQIFRPRAGPDGNYFTPLQGALLRLAIRGFITTNYDLGLEQARMKLRPDSLSTGFATWKDSDEVHRWLTGEIFREQPCPILFAHGVYQRSDTVVLAADEYREAYKSGPYARLFDKLWGEDRLVFAGFGFSDAWLDFLADSVITQTAARMAAAPRHIAIIGLRETEAYTPGQRRIFRDEYNAEALFYPIGIAADGAEDHSALLSILTDLAGEPRATVTAPAAVPPAPRPSAPAIPQKWMHETTEDDRYVERPGVIERLDHWAKDESVRVLAVTGLGGLGKTSLVAYWLKRRDGASRRPVRGLFFWSFYAEHSVDAFIKGLLEFAAETCGFKPRAKMEADEAALALLQTVPLLVVLDGLEVLQERPGQAGYGELLEDDLRELLTGVCRRCRSGLIVLTSRFPFADLEPYLGRGMRALDLDRLGTHEGAALLEICGVRGTIEDRRRISRELEGHPLALRVFAATLAGQGDGDPTRLVERVFLAEGLREDEPLERKLRHLLQFYEQSLPRTRVALLGLVSLFRTPAPVSRLLSLARGLLGVQDVFRGVADDVLFRELEAMARDHLLIRDRPDDGTNAYSCHPILRDHFRKSLLGWDEGVAASAAGLLTGAPSDQRPTDIRQLEPALAAIELLLDANDFQAADELYRGRLDNGELFKHLPAPTEGRRCALGFVAALRRRRRAAPTLRPTALEQEALVLPM